MKRIILTALIALTIFVIAIFALMRITKKKYFEKSNTYYSNSNYYRAIRGINPLLKNKNYYQDEFYAEFTGRFSNLIFQVYHDDQPKGLAGLFYTDKNLSVKTEKVPEGVKYKVSYLFENPGEYSLKCYQSMDSSWQLLSEYTLIYMPEL